MKLRRFIFHLLIVALFVSAAISARSGEVPRTTARLAATRFLAQINRPEHNIIFMLRDEPGFSKPGPGAADYHVFNLHPEGFVIIAGEDLVFPVLGYSRTGHYDPSTIHPAFADWMEGYSIQIADARKNNLTRDASVADAWQWLLTPEPSGDSPFKPTTGVQPLVTSIWNQNFPYNAMCPSDPNAGMSYFGRVPVGCGAVALAMVMNYWRYPATGTGNTCITPAPQQYGPQCADFTGTSYAWNGMTVHPTSACDPAAELCYHAGVALNMNYGSDVSTCYIDSVPSALKNYFRFSGQAQLIERSQYTLSNWAMTLRNNLNARRPMVYFGDGYPVGHIFVCDGYEGNDFFHFNWGWGGLYDGYFYLNNLNPGGQNFTGSQAAVINIYPQATLYPPFCSGSSEITFPEAGSIEDGSGPAENYQNMEDCYWQIRPDDSVMNITLKFIRFSLGPADMLRVYDGPDVNSPMLANLSGNNLPSDINSTGGEMLVRLTSMLSTTSQGFLAEYTCTPYTFCKSDSLYSAPAAQISDGSGPYDYRNETLCLWFICPVGATAVNLSFDDFDTEEGKDVLTVLNPGSTVPLATYSGSYASPPPDVTSSAGAMVLQFTTNKTGRGKGWSGHYSGMVGTSPNEKQGRLKVFPNPVSHTATVQIADLAVEGNLEICLFDFTGRLVHSERIYTSPWVFERNSLPAGVYMLRVRSDSGKFNASSRLVVGN